MRPPCPQNPWGKNSMSSTFVFNEKAAAARLGVSVKTLQARRSAKQGPTYVRVGRSVRYLESDLDAFLAGCRVAPQSEAEVR